MKRTKLDEILEYWDALGADVEILKADGFDECVIGYDYQWDGTIRLIYSVKKIFKSLTKQGMSYEEAIEYFEFNMRGAYVGEKRLYGVKMIFKLK